MKTVLVTGGIGSGKSEVCRYMESKGIPVYDSDSRTKELYNTVPGLVESLENKLSLPFSQWTAIFSDPQKKKQLEDTVYPLVREDFLAWRSRQDAPFVVMESALASSNTFFEDLFDKVVLVAAPEYMRIERVMSRSSLSREKVMERILAQNPFTPHDYQIPNMSGLDALYEKTEKLIKELI